MIKKSKDLNLNIFQKIKGGSFILLFFILLFLNTQSVFALEVQLPGLANNASLPAYVSYFFGLGVYLTMFVAAISFAVGAVSLILSAGNAGAATEAKNRMKSAMLGLTLGAISFLILQTINSAIVTPTLNPLPTPNPQTTTTGPGVYFTDGNNNYIETPKSVSAGDVPIKFNKINYICDKSGGLNIIVWEQPDQGSTDLPKSTIVACNGSLNITNIKNALNWDYETPGMYYCSDGCNSDGTCQGETSTVISESMESPNSEISGYFDIKGIRFVNDTSNYTYFGSILCSGKNNVFYTSNCMNPYNDYNSNYYCAWNIYNSYAKNNFTTATAIDPSGYGGGFPGDNCTAPILSKTAATDCVTTDIKGNSAIIIGYDGNNKPIYYGTWGSVVSLLPINQKVVSQYGVNFYSKPNGWSTNTSQKITSGIFNVKVPVSANSGNQISPLIEMLPSQMCYDYSNSVVPISGQFKCGLTHNNYCGVGNTTYCSNDAIESAQDAIGSMQISDKEKYVVAIYTGNPPSYPGTTTHDPNFISVYNGSANFVNNGRPSCQIFDSTVSNSNSTGLLNTYYPYTQWVVDWSSEISAPITDIYIIPVK